MVVSDSEDVDYILSEQVHDMVRKAAYPQTPELKHPRELQGPVRPSVANGLPTGRPRLLLR